MGDTQQQAVIAIFDGVPAAETAIQELLSWDKANDDVKLGAVGLLIREGGTWGQGEVTSRNFSSRKTARGAKVGMAIGVLAAVLSGGLTLVPSAVGGAVAGAATGSFFRNGLGLTQEDLDRLAHDLEGGHAAILVVCDESDLQPTTDFLVAHGGTPRSRVIDDADLQCAAEAVGVASS